MKSSSYYLFLLHYLIIILLLNSPFARGRKIGSTKSILKTIKVGDEDMIDCIDVHKQLAFRHPLLVNHTIQMEPSMQESKSNSQHEIVALKQSWHKYGRCPQGSIPISRNYKTFSKNQLKKYTPFSNEPPPHHQYSTIEVTGESYHGAIHGALATLNTWDPVVNPLGLSLSQVWIAAGDQSNFNTIEAGWSVNPENGNNQPRIFVYWTKDNYKSTGCHNLECPGFVQTSKDIIVGSPVINLSVYGGQQTEIALTIKKDKQTGNWWLSLHDTTIGYWPSAIFTTLASAGDIVVWGGEVVDTISEGNNTVTQMGSGHFSSEGFGKSSYIRDIKYIDSSGSVVSPTTNTLKLVSTKPSCYDGRLNIHDARLFFFFGGPGC